MNSAKGTMFVILLSFLLLPMYEANKVNCRKYVFAPVCRGVAAKRDLQKLEPLFEDSPRTERYFQKKEMFPDSSLDAFSTKDDNKNAIYYNKGILDIFLKKFSRNNLDYYNTPGTGN